MRQTKSDLEQQISEDSVLIEKSVKIARSKKWRWLLLFLCLLSLSIGYVVSPYSPLVGGWHPLSPLSVTDKLGPFTSFKVKSAMLNKQQCQNALRGYVSFRPAADKEYSERCHIRNRVVVDKLGLVDIGKVDTRCEVALRAAMWVEHGIQPAAQEFLGQSVSHIRTQGSYNCRTIAGSQRMSLHAQAKALDVAGFRLTDGRKIELSQHWQDNAGAAESKAIARFLHAVRDSACQWFVTVLGPDYNAAHKDHFHLQSSGWGTCR